MTDTMHTPEVNLIREQYQFLLNHPLAEDTTDDTHTKGAYGDPRPRSYTIRGITARGDYWATNRALFNALTSLHHDGTHFTPKNTPWHDLQPGDQVLTTHNGTLQQHTIQHVWTDPGHAFLTFEDGTAANWHEVYHIEPANTPT